MSPDLLLSRTAVVGGMGLLGLAAVLLPYAPSAQAQSQACSCAQPSVGLMGPDGLCQCPCGAVPIPGIDAETLSGPPKPPKAGGPAPTWTVEPGFEDGFGGPFWGDWW